MAAGVSEPEEHIQKKMTLYINEMKKLETKCKPKNEKKTKGVKEAKKQKRE